MFETLENWDRIPVSFLQTHRRFYLRIRKPQDRLQIVSRVLTWSPDIETFRLFGPKNLYQVTHWRGVAHVYTLPRRGRKVRPRWHFVLFSSTGDLVRRAPALFAIEGNGSYSPVDGVPWEIHMIPDNAAYKIAYEAFCHHA